MIEFDNKKNRFLIFFFRKYFEYSFKRNFFRINLKGKELLESTIRKSKSSEIPVILILNHPNWWDAAFVVHFSYNYMKMDGYCFMEYKQMKDFKFFNKIGAVPIIRENAEYSLKSLNFVAESIKNKSRLAVIFPQAELTHNSKKPCKLYSGFYYLMTKIERGIIICGFLDYRFTTEQRPELFVNIFKSYKFNSDGLPEKLSYIKSLETEYELIYDEFEKDFTASNLAGYEMILQGRNSKGK
ncbi:MAG: lysophospholipid acyltransferase family protein [Ignavibacteria bacterium]|nr:lysophospholipid acyltransferase family protein [Ignavibacteria bacterium]